VAPYQLLIAFESHYVLSTTIICKPTDGLGNNSVG